MANHNRPEYPHLLLALQNALRDNKRAEDLYVALVAAFGEGITKQDVFNKVVRAQLSLIKLVILCAVSGVVGGFIAHCFGGQ